MAFIAAVAAVAAGVSNWAHGANKTWLNTGTDFNTTGNWGGGTPTSADVALFATAAITQPNLSASLTIQELNFSAAASSGYTLSASAGQALTLTNVGTGATSAINAADTTGINTIGAPIILGGAAASTATFTQAAGGTLSFSGAISSTNAITGLALAAGGNYTLSASNSYAGTTTTSGAASTLNLGNVNALSTGNLIVGGTLTINNTSGAAMSISNGLNLNGTLTFAGTSAANNLTFASTTLLAGTERRVNVTNAGGRLQLDNVNYNGGRLRFGDASNAAATLVLNTPNTGSGLSELIGSTTYTTAIQQRGGVIEVGNKDAFGPSSNALHLRGFTIQSNTDLTGANALANTIVLATGGQIINGSTGIEFSGSFIKSFGVSSQTLTINNSGTTKWSGPVSMTDLNQGAQTLTFSTAGTAGPAIVSGVIQDSTSGSGSGAVGNFQKQGPNTLVLSGANTYTGITRVLNGTVQLTGSISSSSFLRMGQISAPANPVGTLILGGSTIAVSQTFSGLDSAGAGTTNQVAGGNAGISTLTANVNVDSTYAGAFGGTNGNEANISFTKAGGNLLTVSGTNATNMAGDLNITGGGIAFNSPASSTFGAVNITNATMSFNGASNTTMSGAVNVTNGSLTFNGATSGITATTGAMTISDNSTLSVKVNNTTSARLTTTALTLGAGGSTTLNVDMSGLGNPSTVISTGTLTANGTTTVNLTNFLGLTSGSIPLIDYTSFSGTGTFTPTSFTLSGRTTATLTNDVANTVLRLDVAQTPIVWDGKVGSVVDGTWDKAEGPGDAGGTLTFVVGGTTETAYQESTAPGDSVIFNDTATGTTDVNITETVTPTSVAVNNNSLSYSFNGGSGIAGPTGLTKTGTAKLTINNQNSYTGLTTVSGGGTLALGNSGSIASGVTITSSNLDVAGTIAGTVTATSSTIRLTSNTPTIGGLIGDNASPVINTLSGITTLSLAGGGSYSGNLTDGAGTLALNKSVAGLQILSGTNPYTGGTTISGGDLRIESIAAIGPGSVTLSGGRLLLPNAINFTNPINVTSSGGGVAGQGLIYLNTANTSGTVSGPINITASPSAGGIFAANGTGTLTITGAITASADVSVRAGTVIFTNPANNFSVIKTTGGGIITLGANNALTSTATLDISNAGVFNLAGFNQTLATIIGTGDNITNSGSGTSVLTLTGNSLFDGNFSDGLTGKLAVVVNGGSVTLTATNSHTGGTTLESGTINLTDTSGGTFGNGSLGGPTNLLTVNGGTVDLANTAQTVGGLSGSGGVITVNNQATAARALTVGGANVDTTYAGSLTDGAFPLALIKQGTGTQTLSGTSTYTGITTISTGVVRVPASGAITGSSQFLLATTGGILQVDSTGQLGSGSINIPSTGGATGSTARLEVSGNSTVGNPITLALRNDPLGSDAIRSVGGNNTLSGAITIIGGGTQGRVQVDSGTLTLSGPISTTATGSRILTVQGAGNGIISGVVTDGAGAFGITKSGTGKWTIIGSNTYTGTTTVQAGTLEVAGPAQAPVLFLAGGADIQGGRLILDYTGPTSPAIDLRNALQAGRVRDSVGTAGFIGVGYSDDGSTKVTALATVIGDANLDGRANALDFNVLATNYGAGQFWPQGDFNYDGQVDTSDFNLLATNFNQSVTLAGPSLDESSSLGTLVPEPIGLPFISLALSAMTVRRRRL